MLRNLLVAIVVLSSGSMVFGGERYDDGKFHIVHENPHLCTITVQRGDCCFILLDGRCVVVKIGQGAKKIVKGTGQIVEGTGNFVIGAGYSVFDGVRKTGCFLIGVPKKIIEGICRPRCCCYHCRHRLR